MGKYIILLLILNFIAEISTLLLFRCHCKYYKSKSLRRYKEIRREYSKINDLLQMLQEFILDYNSEKRLKVCADFSKDITRVDYDSEEKDAESTDFDKDNYEVYAPIIDYSDKKGEI